MTFQLPTKDEKHHYVLEQFERIAKGYDRSNDVISMGMHRSWKLRAVWELISHKPDGKYLDMCCGTGDLALLIARMTCPGSQVVGLDFAQNMLELAAIRHLKALRRKPQLQGKELSFKRGDAQNLPFQNEDFDGAIVSFGLRNLTDLQKGLNEMARVVKSGGKVVNLDLGHTTVPVFKDVYSFYFRQVVPVIGELLQNDKTAYTYLPESASTYPKPQEISRMFESAGLENVRHIPLAFGTVALHIGEKP